MTSGRLPKYKTPKEMQSKIDEYFAIKCADEVVMIGDKEIIKYNPPTISGLALFLDFMDRCSLYDYINREKEYSPDEQIFTHTIKKAIARIEEYAEKQLHVGNSTGAIFWLKNRGWKDKTEVDSNNNHNIVVMGSVKKDGKDLSFKIGQEKKDND